MSLPKMVSQKPEVSDGKWNCADIDGTVGGDKEMLLSRPLDNDTGVSANGS